MKFALDKLSSALMRARVIKGYSQTYMAQQLRLSQKSYSYIESGHCKLELTRFLQIAHITETHPMQFIEKISEGNPSWECIRAKEESLNSEIVKLNAEITYLKSHSLFLQGTINKLLELQKEKDQQLWTY